MSAQQPVDVVQGIYAAFGRKDFEGIIAAMADDVSWIVHGPASVGYFGDFSGRSGVRRWSDTLRETIVVDRFAVENLYTDGDSVIVLGSFAATSTATGRPYETPFVHVWTVRSGAVVGFVDFMDTAAAVAAHSH